MRNRRPKRRIKSEVSSLDLPVGYTFGDDHLSIRPVLRRNELTMALVLERKTIEGFQSVQMIAIPYELHERFLAQFKAFHREAKYFFNSTDRSRSRK